MGFVGELKRQQNWDKVTMVSASDFGRTLTSNGMGTDHGWGGNHFVLGGALRGGRVLGEYPLDLWPGGENADNRGRMIPTRPLEAIWHAVAEWMGVDSQHM